MKLNKNQQLQHFPIIIAAPSGSGKSSIIKEFLKRHKEVDFSISTTTRKLRANEIDGQHYYYASEKEFKQKIEDDYFVEWAIVHNKYYGTSMKEIDRIINNGSFPLLDLDTKGAQCIQNFFSNSLSIFILPPSYKILKQRLIMRETESEKSIKTRLKNARKEIQAVKLFDYLIINDDFDKAANLMEQIFITEKNKASKIKSNSVEQISITEKYKTSKIKSIFFKIFFGGLND